MNILDTDHISELQYPNSPRGALLLGRIAAVDTSQLATTIVTVEEQTRGWLAEINRSPSGLSQVDAYNGFANLMVFCRKWIILPFDALAAQQFHMLKTQKVRISTMDLKIASIALAHSATLLSANLRDFRQVPDLTVEDWLS
jgi:tRNA(fMet)-specific endonuclease VapC